MINSNYVADILKLLFEGENEGLLANKQLPFTTEDDYEYTGGGLFVSFNHDEEALEYKVSKSDLVLKGVKIESTEFEMEAEATLFFKDGLISLLEIWCYMGEYPQQDLTKYTLLRIFENSENISVTIAK